MRALPFSINQNGQNTDLGNTDRTALNLLRISITLFVAKIFADPVFDRILDHAYTADEFIDDASHGFPQLNSVLSLFETCNPASWAYGNIDAAAFKNEFSSLPVADFMMQAFEHDTRLREANQHNHSPQEILMGPLWFSFNEDPGGLREGSFATHLGDQLAVYFGYGKGPWSFWDKWYDGFLLGRPLDWELQRRVALIPDEVWEAGVEAVAKEIEAIERTYIRETTIVKEDPNHFGGESARHDGALPKLILSRVKVVPPLIEQVETEKLTLPRSDDHKIDPLEFALNNIRHALNYALRECAENGFSDATEEASIIKFALDSLPKEPRYIAGPFHHASCLFERKFENTEYQRHAALTFLCNQLKAHVIAFVTEDPSIRDHIESYGSLPEPEPVSAETVTELQNASEVLEPVLDEDAREVVAEITDTFEAGQPPSKYGWAVLVQWFAQIWTYLDKLKKHSGIATWVWKVLEKLFSAS